MSIHLECAKENTVEVVVDFCRNEGMYVECTPAHGHQSNGVADGYVRELGTRARVLLFGSKFRR